MKKNGPRTDEATRALSRPFDHQFYRAMASRERRRLLYLLLDGEERTVEDVATVLVGWDATASGTVGDPDDRKLVLLRLVHIHLPLLADAGIVNYDEAAGTVSLASLEASIREAIEQGSTPNPTRRRNDVRRDAVARPNHHPSIHRLRRQ